MGNGNRARLLRVVDEITLHKLISFLPDDFDRILIGADGAICTQAVEQRSRYIIGFCAERWIRIQRQMGDIIDDAEREVALWLVLLPLVEYRL